VAEHRPTLGSRVRVWRDPVRNKRVCECGGRWPCHWAMEAQHVWRADGSPIPDRNDGGPPVDFVQTIKGDFFRLARSDRGETWRSA
jgi:hypothetical protein